jgi:drug/metabolite transporter (DMT)-like permease
LASDSHSDAALAAKPKTPGVLLVALGSALWGTDSVLRRPLTRSLASPAIVLYEHLILSVIALPVLIASWKELRELRLRHWLAVLGIAWGGSALATVLFTEAISRGNVNTAVLLQKAQPLFTFLLAGPLLGEHSSRRNWRYLALGAAGAWLVSFGDHGLLPPLSHVEITAALFALGASALWGSSTVLGRILSPRFSFLTVTSLRFVVALPLLFVISLRYEVALPALTAAQFWRVVAMALVPGLAALLLYYRGLGSTTAPVAAIAELAFPATAVILNWTFLAQRPAVLQVVGFAVIWFVVWRIQRGHVAEAGA